jgi:Arc/MetJ family transcription regulator
MVVWAERRPTQCPAGQRLHQRGSIELTGPGRQRVGRSLRCWLASVAHRLLDHLSPQYPQHLDVRPVDDGNPAALGLALIGEAVHTRLIPGVEPVGIVVPTCPKGAAYTLSTRSVYGRCMAKVRTNIEIEDSYLQAVMDRYHLRTKTEAVDLALRHLAGQPMTREEALAMRGARAIRKVPADSRPPSS